MVAPRPYNPNGPETFDLSSDFDMSGANLLWYARLQLLFRCTLCPTGALQDRKAYKEVSLVFFSTFEPVELTPDSRPQHGLCMSTKWGSLSGENRFAAPLHAQ